MGKRAAQQVGSVQVSDTGDSADSPKIQDMDAEKFNDQSEEAEAAVQTQETDTVQEDTSNSQNSESKQPEEAINQENKNQVEDASTASTALSALHVEGTTLCDENGKVVQLRGVSTHGLAWYPQYVNQELFRELKEDWKANVVRLAMYTEEYGGYCNGGKTELTKLVEDGISYAKEAGLYVIVDWHILSDNNPLTHQKEAEGFFGELSKTHKDDTHILYEICNEPNGNTSWADIKKYAEAIIPVIRENDEDAVILVGTPTWSQEVDKALADPITDYDNLMYTLHFYAATHRDDLRNNMTSAVDQGLPVFVSEFGICDASGNGGIDEGQADLWMKACDERNISYVSWALSNKNETAALFLDSCDRTSGFGDQDLSASGRWVYKHLSGEAARHRDPNEEKASEDKTSEDNKTSDSVSDKNNQDTSKEDGKSEEEQTDNQSQEIREKGQLVLDDGRIQVYLYAQDSWEGEDGISTNYRMEIANVSGEDMDSWDVTITFTEAVKDINGWNGNYKIDGKKLRITNVDYNGQIMSGKASRDIGFIVTTAKQAEVESCISQ